MSCHCQKKKKMMTTQRRESQNSHDEDVFAAWNWCLWSLDKWRWQQRTHNSNEKRKITVRDGRIYYSGREKKWMNVGMLNGLVKMKMMMENLTVVSLSKKKICRAAMRGGKKFRFPLNSKLVLMWFLLWSFAAYAAADGRFCVVVVTQQRHTRASLWIQKNNSRMMPLLSIHVTLHHQPRMLELCYEKESQPTNKRVKNVPTTT